MKFSPILLALLSALGVSTAAPAAGADPAPGGDGARLLRVYMAGESIERRNRYVAPPFTSSGALNERGGGELRNDMDEYGWMVPFRDRLRLRAPDLGVAFVGSGFWANDDDATYTGAYPSTTAEPTSAISGSSIPSWLEQRREELEGKAFCYDLAFASRGGNDLGNDNDDEYRAQLKELVLLLWRGSACRTDPVVVVTGHMPDDQRGGMSDTEYVALERHRFVERARQAVDELRASQPTLRVRFVDQYTPFLENTPTTAFPAEVWSVAGIPDYDKIVRGDDRYHPRRLASIYAGELAADGLDLAELRSLAGPGTWLLPASARVEGRGAFWTTELLLRNTGSASASATVRFLGHSGDGRNGPEVPVTLAPGETKAFTDVLSTLFGLESDYGPLLVRSEANLVVQGQTSTPGGGGTYGQSVPAVPAGDLVAAIPRTIVGVRQDAGFRTNLMLANGSTQELPVAVEVVSRSGERLASLWVTLGPLSSGQLNVGDELGVNDVRDAALVLSNPTGAGGFTAYASAIDQVTGDPRTLLPVAAAGSGRWLLPSSARVPGQGAFWTTDLLLRNQGSEVATAKVKFLGHGADGRAGPEVTVTLQPGETVPSNDVLHTLFGLDEDYGPLLVTSDAPLVVQGQTATPGGGGTYGQSVPALPASGLIGAAPRSIVGVRQDASFRTNLMLANGTEVPTDVDVALVGPGGGTPRAGRTVRLGPLSFAQLNVAKDLGVEGIAGATLLLSTQTPGGAFAGYASVIDQATGDPRTLLPR